MNLNPRLSNFNIKDSEKSRVYFDSDKALSVGINGKTGFRIDGKDIFSVTINGTSFVDHFFTLTSPLTSWDNLLIDYKGEGDMTDLFGNKLLGFYLERVKNNIAEPVSSTIKYASPNGSGNKDGSSKGNAYSYALSLSNAKKDETHMWLAGSSTLSGKIDPATDDKPTADEPFKIIGYNDASKDVLRERTRDMTMDSTIMPLLTGSGTGISIDRYNPYVIIKNVQTEKLEFGYDVHSFFQLENFYHRKGEMCVKARAAGGYNESNIRCTRGWTYDVTEAGFRIANNYHLMDDWIMGSTYDISMDYFFSCYGGGAGGFWGCIANCVIDRHAGKVHGGHGYSIKGNSDNNNKLERMLIENCTGNNVGQLMQFRHSTTRFCVARNITGTMTDWVNETGGVNGNLVTFRDDCSYNVIIDSYGKDLASGIRYDMNARLYKPVNYATAGGFRNKVINTVFEDCAVNILCNKGTQGNLNSTSWAKESTYNEYINCQFKGGRLLVLSTDQKHGSTNTMVNSDVNGCTERDGDVTYITNNFDDNDFSKPTSGNNLSLDPMYNPFPIITNEKLRKGTFVSSAEYDVNGVQRPNNNWLIGINEIDPDTPPPVPDTRAEITWKKSDTVGVFATRIFRNDIPMGDVSINVPQLWIDPAPLPGDNSKYEVQAVSSTGVSTKEEIEVNVTYLTIPL